MKKLIFFIAVLFLGCANKEIPKWYLKNYPDNNEFIYATGEGKNKKEATNSALNEIISKIEITLSSNIDIQKSVINSNGKTSAYENISQIIKTYIPKTKIYDYKILKTAKDSKYYVLIAVNKIKNANLIYDKAQKEIQLIRNSMSNDEIYILKKYPKLIKQTDKIISNLYFAYTMFPSPKIKHLIQKANNLKNILIKQYNNVGFEIKKDYANILKETLSSLNFPLKKGIKSYINANVTRQKVMDYYITTINMTVLLKDKSEMVIGLICSGKSINNYNLAQSFALKECKKRLKEKLLKISR